MGTRPGLANSARGLHVDNVRPSIIVWACGTPPRQHRRHEGSHVPQTRGTRRSERAVTAPRSASSSSHALHLPTPRGCTQGSVLEKKTPHLMSVKKAPHPFRVLRHAPLECSRAAPHHWYHFDKPLCHDCRSSRAPRLVDPKASSRPWEHRCTGALSRLGDGRFRVTWAGRLVLKRAAARTTPQRHSSGGTPRTAAASAQLHHCCIQAFTPWQRRAQHLQGLPPSARQTCGR